MAVNLLQPRHRADSFDDHDGLQVTTAKQLSAADPAAVFAEILDRLAPYNKHGIAITEATDINADLNIDSVAILDLLMTIEDVYDISIPINLLTDVRTVGDLAATVQRTIEGRPESGSV